ncbi:VOC family protein [Agrococcus baldri]|uniref:Glyoxalase n=1 Tax=Agrococcus baldri TaxID=153730 RepID=A0AA87URF3_9MICO|nr:VOC family protein [Agrococcus baldri]GEK79425.1 glyoxalase [Agrococcus baldri]
MQLNSLYPVLATDDVAGTAEFYRIHFGFETSFEADWYVSLRLGAWELAILQAGHATIPGDRPAATASGILLNVEVDDVDAVHDRLVAAGLTAALPLRSEEFGQRHAVFVAPDGVLLDIITPIAPSGAFAEQFSEEALREARDGAA